LNKVGQASFDASEGYLILELHMQDFTLRTGGVRYKGPDFQAKDEVHITILCALRRFMQQGRM
jgi:hypothetical protein